MEEKISRTESRELSFESSGQKIKLTIELNNLNKGDASKTKNFLKTMFEEILCTI